MDVKLKRSKRVSLPVTLGAFAVGVIAALGVLWVADRPRSDPGLQAPAPVATGTAANTTAATSGTAAEGTTVSAKSTSTDSATATSAAVRLVAFDASLSGDSAVLRWGLSASPGKSTVLANAGDVNVSISELDGQWTPIIEGASPDALRTTRPPVISGSTVVFALPAAVLGKRPITVTPGVRSPGDAEIVFGNAVTLD